MKQIINRAWLMAELKVAIALAVTFFTVDAASVLLRLYNGDFSREVWTALGLIALQSVVRAVLSLAFPSIFSHVPVKASKLSK